MLHEGDCLNECQCDQTLTKYRLLSIQDLILLALAVLALNKAIVRPIKVGKKATYVLSKAKTAGIYTVQKNAKRQ